MSESFCLLWWLRRRRPRRGSAAPRLSLWRWRTSMTTTPPLTWSPTPPPSRSQHFRVNKSNYHPSIQLLSQRYIQLPRNNLALQFFYYYYTFLHYNFLIHFFMELQTIAKTISLPVRHTSQSLTCQAHISHTDLSDTHLTH